MARRTSSSRRPDPSAEACPCGLLDRYADCCGPLHRGTGAASPARLMRSRYTAFALRDEPYLLRSWHPRTRPGRLDLDPALRWTGLEVLDEAGGSAFHQEGVVEFRAHYVENGRAGHLHERSRFLRHQGAWLYLDGETRP